MSHQRTRQKRAAGDTELSQAEVKGKIVEFAWQLKKDGYADSKIKTCNRVLQGLLRKNVNLLDAEAVKEHIAKRDLSGAESIQ